MISLRKGSSALLAAALLLTGACGDTETTTEPIVPATLSVVGSSTVEAPANFPVAEPLRVRLTTRSGQPVSGQLVRFVVSTGGKLSNDSSFTDENGEASVGVTVGAVGTFTVTATVAGVAPVTFVATAVAPVATVLLAAGGNNQSGLANEALSPLQAVVLKSDGSPAVGVPVTFTVTSGGGSVSAITVNTNANGVASTTFTIGSSGAQTVLITSPGLPSATFTATIANACLAARSMVIPETKNRTLESSDCVLPDGRFAEYFDITGAATAAFSITETSTAFAPAVVLFSGADTVGQQRGSSTATSVGFKFFAPAGTYRAGASTRNAGSAGAYTLTTAAIPAGTNITNCERVFIMPGVTIDQNISLTDCTFTQDNTQHSDFYRIYLKAGQKIGITLQSIPLAANQIDMWIVVLNANTGVAVAQQDCCGSNTIETTSYTATTPGQYIIEAGVYFDATAPTPVTGNYRLVVTQQ